METLAAVDWLAVQAIATIVTGVVLLATLVAILLQLRHAQAVRDDQLRPHVVVDIEPSHVRSMVDFTVRNLGATAAYDVRFDIRPELVTTMDDDGYPLKDSLLIREGIPTLPPGRTISTLFDQVPNRLQAKMPMRFEAKVTYRDRRGTEHAERSVIDLEVFSGLVYIDQKGPHEAAKALQEISKTMSQWTQSHRGVHVFTQDYDRFAWRNGLLIQHPNLFIRAIQQVLNRLPGVETHSRERRRTHRAKRIRQGR